MVDDGCPTCGTCAGATPVTAPGGRFTVTTSTSTHNGSCGGAAGAEATMTFSIGSTSDVFITTHQSLLDTVLYVRQCACTGGPEMGCNDDANGVTSSALTLSDLAPGTYNVFVDSKVAMSQSITVDVYINDATGPNDRCGEPFSIAPGLTNLTGTTCPFTGDYDLVNTAGMTGCPFTNGGDGAEAVAYFVVPTARTITMTGCTGTLYDSVVYMRSVCSDASAPAQLNCNDDNCGTVSGMCDSTVASGFSQSLSPGIYYLFIDGYTDAGCGCGNFNLAFTGL